MKGEIPELGITQQAVAREIRENVQGIKELIPLITSLEQWQAILAKADPAYREQIRELIEPFLPFKVPGVEPATPSARAILYDDFSLPE